ncbi:MAG: type II secretion system F family protein [archaeon]
MNELKENIRHMQEIARELYVFSNQLAAIKNLEVNSNVIINKSEKDLLESTIISLTNQLRIINDSVPKLLDMFGPYKTLPKSSEALQQPSGVGKVPAIKLPQSQLSRITYKLTQEKEVSLVISEKDKNSFLENLRKSRLSINLLKKKFHVEKIIGGFQKSSSYTKLSNRFFRKYSNRLIVKGYFKELNRSLRKINSRFVLGSYVSMILFTSFIAFILAIILFIVLLFFNISIISPFLNPAEFDILRIMKVFLVIPLLPIITGVLFYFYPFSEAKSLGAKIDQELPFVTIHMSAIASSGVEPLGIFKIVLKGGDYKYTNIELKKLMNLINFHGEDIVTALRKISASSSSQKLKELLNGFSVTITSGGSLHSFLDEHAEGMLFDYRLEREKYNKISETFMDIYISIAIAAPMILLMVFVIIGSTGMMGNVFGLGTKMLSVLMMMMIVVLNIFFLIFLRMKQPMM